ncbi:MAG: PilZ domain-containing protein [Candidatus Acidiferrum sp.]
MTESNARPRNSIGTDAPPFASENETPKQRRSGRLSLALPILIIGTDTEGRVFSEKTHTVVVSLHGAGIVSRHRLIAEQELILRALQSEREVEVRVVGEIAQQGDLHTYGVAFTDENLDFWQMEFPPAPVWPERPTVLSLECGGCKGVVEVRNGEYDGDICAIHGGLVRYCHNCGLLTVWRRSLDIMPSRPASCSAQKEPRFESTVAIVEPPEPQSKHEEVISLAEPIAPVERRNRIRAKVNFFACVRSEQFGEDIVTCIDMSRDGVSFRSGKAYQKGMELQIAVPFSPEAREAPAIFVNARIANVREMPGGTMWRCGVEFLHS